MKTLSLIIAVLGFVGAAHAADQHNFHNLGFSADGKYFAYATSVVQDGSGYGVAEINIKSLQNYDATPVLTVKQMTEEGDARAALKIAMQSVNFAAYKIAPGTLKGQTIKATSGSEVTVNANGANYKLTLSSNPAPHRPDYCQDAPNASLVSINITKGNSTSVLVDEQYAPEKRACAYNYEIVHAITSGDKVALVISYNATGFEGPDTKYMIVTTVLE